jgi:putative oxidoreductase
MKKLFQTASLDTDVAALLIRLIIGCLFIYHGYQKIESYDKILPLFGDYIGIGSKLSFNLTIFAEFGCGLLVALGFLTRLTIIPIFITMIVVVFIALKKENFMMKELPLVYLLSCFVVFVLGSGKYSVDKLIFKK